MASDNSKLSKPALQWGNIIDKGLMWVFVLGILLLLAYTYYRPATTGKDEKKFSGKIVNKYTTSLETKTGSIFTRYLEIEEKAGRHRNLKVNEDTFQKAKPGMWIEIDDSGMRLYQSENEIKSQ
jgi:hypothetical protein